MDTIGIKLPVERVSDGEYMKRLPNLLSNTNEVKKSNGFTFINGYIGNLYVSISESGVKINGSLSKYHIGNNYSDFTRKDLEHSFEKLGDDLSLNLTDAKVLNIDIAHNLTLNHRCDLYFDQLLDSPRYQRFRMPHSVYWENGTLKKKAYDKVFEVMAKKEHLPEYIEALNLFRFEVSIKKNVSRVFSKNSVTVKDLYNEHFYMGMQDKWLHEFKNITKQQNLVTMPNANLIITPTEYSEYLKIRGLGVVGFEQAMNDVNSFNQMDKMGKSRLRKMLRELNKKSNFTDQSDLINELNEKAKQAIQYYR